MKGFRDFILRGNIVDLAVAVHPDEEPAAPTEECPECLSSIPVGAVRCAFCTVPLPV